jgi:hypothetical protein
MARYLLSVILAMSVAGCVAYAGTDDDEYIRVARISYMEGHVSFQHTSDVDWTAASINLPLQPGDRIYTGKEGRAEIQFDEGSVYRLAEGTDIQFLSLSEDLIQIRIMTGLSSLTVSSGISFEMDTPAAAFIVLSRGVYRFDTRDNGDTDAVVRKGELETVSHRFVRRVESGERIFVTADENSSYNIARYSGRDAWDEWNDRRDADFIARSSRGYLPDTVYVGASDLDRYGRWVTVESYGTAWVPYSVGVSWSPYSVGRWCYRPVWGWTWVSYEPWGWIPYHYGRWYRSARFGWCWLPGPSFSFNFWSPGLVTFYYGPSWVSWCPLGPGDYYSINNYYYNHRLYGRHVASLSRLHWRAAGQSINLHVRGAFRSVEIEHFRNGGSRAIATKNGYRQIEQPWNRGTLVRERLAVQPTARSFSADPDGRAERSRLVNPRPAVVQNTPRAKTVSRSGYVRVTNPEATSRSVAKLKNVDTHSNQNVENVDTHSNQNSARQSDTGQVHAGRNAQSRSLGTVGPRSAGSAVTGGQSDRRIIRSSDADNRAGNNRSPRNSAVGRVNESTDRGKNKDTHDSNVDPMNRSGGRVISPDSSGSRSDGSVTIRSAVPRSSSELNSDGNSGSGRIIESREKIYPSGGRIQSTPQSPRSKVGDGTRTNRSYSQPDTFSSPGSNSSNRSYSAPSSSSRSRARTYSVPSSGSQSRSYSAPSSNNRSRSYSAPSPGINNRSYSSPRSSSSNSLRTPSSGPSSNSGKADAGARKAKRR